MAMTKCDECGGDVSTKASTCVHCGTSFLSAPEPDIDWLALGGLLFGGAILALMFLNYAGCIS